MGTWAPLGSGLPRVAAFVATFWCVPAAWAQASPGSRESMVLVLKDPTPRPPDLDKMYGTPGPPGVVANSPERKRLNEQRFALITHASSQMRTFAGVLQKAIAAEPRPASLAPEIQVAGVIEMLASNVHSAVLPAPTVQSLPKEEKARAVAAQVAEVDLRLLNAEASELVTITGELQNEVDRSTADTLSVGLLTKSAEVSALARSLQMHMRRK